MILTPVRKFATKTCSNIGSNFAKSKTLQKVGKFFEADGFNMGGAAFNTLILSAVVAPRMIQARDADERREILTRDATTILTLLFAMKGLKAGFSKAMSKVNGLVLTNKGAAEGKNVVAKAFDYIKPSGISSLSSGQITSKYGQISTKDELVKLLEYVKNGKGNIAKVLNTGKELAGETAHALGDISKKGADEIIDMVKKAPEEKLSGILNILKDVENPLTKAGKKVNALLEAGSLGIIISFLGFGLPAINKKITEKNHMKNKVLNREPLPAPLFNNSLKITPNQKEVFKQFLG